MVPTRTCALLVAAAMLVHAGEARACSKIPLARVRTSSLAFVVGSAAADTVPAGPGFVDFRVAPGHSGPAGERTVYGQVVQVRRIGGLAAARLPAETERVVLVPWDYGADCRPTPWTRSARWVAPGTEGLFTAVLRDPRHWAGTVPTFDVMSPDLEPYPARGTGPLRMADQDSLLTVDQLFSVMELLPDAAEQRVDAAAAAEPLLAWARANPERARRYPALQMVRFAVHAIEAQRLSRVDPPLAGTYRFEARLNGGAPATFYARTRRHPTTEWNPSRSRRASDDPTRVSVPEGYTILAAGADALEVLPYDVGGSRRINREAYFSVLADPESAPEGGWRWRGQIEIDLVARQFPTDSATQAFARAARDRSYQAYMQQRPDEVEATFLLRPDGSVRVEQTTDLGGGRRMEIRGERVSRITIPDPG